MGIALNRLGLCFNFVGGVLIALSITRLPSEGYQKVPGWLGRRYKVQIAGIRHPGGFWIGMVLLALGFAVSLVSTFVV